MLANAVMDNFFQGDIEVPGTYSQITYQLTETINH